MATAGISAKTFNSVSQFAHFGVAGFIFMVIGKFMHGPLFWWLIGLGVALAAWKEFYYDENYENVEVRGSSWQDFAFYVLGILAGVILSVI